MIPASFTVRVVVISATKVLAVAVVAVVVVVMLTVVVRALLRVREVIDTFVDVLTVGM